MSLQEIVVAILPIAAVAFLVLLNGFFVASEFAIVKIRDTQLDTLVDRGHRRAKSARKIVHNLDAALSATQLGITLASLGLGWVGKPVFVSLLAPVFRHLNVQAQQAEWLAFAVGFTTITFLHIVAGELAPKSLAIQKPLSTSLWVAYPLTWFYNLFFPFIWLLNQAALQLLRWCGLDPMSESESAHTEDELRLIIGRTHRSGSDSSTAPDIVLNAIDLRHRQVREVMRPRRDIVALNTEAPIPDCLGLVEKTGYSRFPLCTEGDLDKTLGVVHFKDLMARRIGAQTAGDLAALTHDILFIPETARLEGLLRRFLKHKLHFALVVDEYGGTVGMATLENVLETLVGPIQDEFDHEAPLLRETGAHRWKLSGSLPLRELGDLVSERFEDEGQATTVAGLLTHRLGRFPMTGDVLTSGPWTLRVEAAERALVKRIELTISPEALPPVDAPGAGDTLSDEAQPLTAPPEDPHRPEAPE